MNYRQVFSQELKDLYDEHEVQTLFYIIMENLTGKSKLELLTCKYKKLSMKNDKIFKNIIEKLKKNQPFQYVLGRSSFCGLTFNVDSNVLIPRPETEELVHWILDEATANKQLTILDIGTGSGCIAISLAKHLPSASIHAIDISQSALNVAKSNATFNKINVQFHLIDIFTETDTIKDNFDFIVSNPPYICENEKKDMSSNVLDYEPPIALFVPDNDPLLFYRQITDFALNHLNDNGKLFFEINPRYHIQLVDMLKEKGFNDVICCKDMYDKNRMIMAMR